MVPTDHTAPPAGRAGLRWFLFLVFFHLLPVPWYLAVAAGLAPAVFLFAAGVAGLFVTDAGSLPLAAMLLGPALSGGFVSVLLSYLLAAGIGKLKQPLARTLGLILVLAACLGAALYPIYISGSHGGGHRFGVLDFIDILGQFRIPSAVAAAYFVSLAVVLLGLLIHQHAPRRFATFRPGREHARRLRRWSMLGGAILFVAVFCWVHRVLFFVKPLAEMGFACAQYRLALALQAHPGSEVRSELSFRDWLERAAKQGHIDAAMALVRSPRSAEEKQRWLTAAAEAGLAEAQYQLYRFIVKSGCEAAGYQNALSWLQSAAGGGHADAQYELARFLSRSDNPLGLAKDLEAARRWWEKAAGNDHGRAMEELAWRYAKGADGFPRYPERSTALLEKIAEGYRQGRYGLPENKQMAEGMRHQAEEIGALEQRAARGDAQALVALGRQLLQVPNAAPQVAAEGLGLLEKAAALGDAEIQYELGAIFLFGRHGVAKNLERGRGWWNLALQQKHVKTMEYVAPAYQNGRFGYPVDLLKSKALVELLVEAYRDGRYGVDPDAGRERYWAAELKHFDRLFDLAGGRYLPLDDLQREAEAGRLQAQYQLGRQLLVAGSESERRKGRQWLQRAAEGGFAEAQFRLVTDFENQVHIMRDNPARGVTLLKAAASQNHLRAMGTLALAYEKGRYGLAQDYRQAQNWYHKLLQAYQSGQYLGEVDERFIAFQRRRLEYVSKALSLSEDRARRYEQATPLERRIMAIEDRYRLEYRNAVNALDRRDGSQEGMKRFQAEVERLRQLYARQRELEVEKVKREAAKGR